MRKKFIAILFIGAFIFLAGEAGNQYSLQPPFNYTGAEGSTCAQCHGNFNNGGGSIVTAGLPADAYTEGQVYNFAVTIAHPSVRGRWGFSIGARDANNQPVGSFSSINPNAALNVNELSHFMAVFRTGNSFTYDSLRWLAPVNPTTAQKTVTFYYIGNAANGDRGLTGDFIYSGTKTIGWSAGNQLPLVAITSPANNSVYAAGHPINLTAVASDADGSIARVSFYNNGVKFLEDSTAPYGLVSTDAEPGSYVITARATDNEGAVKISDTVRLTITGCTAAGSITGEGYTNIPGTQVSDLTSNAAYPNNPSINALLSEFEYANVGDNYGARVRGYICAPQTGNYTFYIAGDDQAGLWLSTDESATNKVLIAYNEVSVGFRAWTTFATQQSAPVKLVKGARYYIETLHKQGAGANHLSVGWVLPDGTQEGPIPGNRLSPVAGNAGNRVAQDFTIAMEKINSVVTGLQVKASPNPSNGYFTIITNSSDQQPLSITVTDVLGRTAERKTNIAANGTIRMGGGLKAGIYFIEVSQGNQKQRLKLVKQ